jgi:hypothetical protein
VPRVQRDGSLRPYFRISRPEPLLFLSSSSSVVLTRLSGPRKGTGDTELLSKPIYYRCVESSIYLILPAALGPGIYSAFNRNEYQKQKNNVPGE